MKLTKREYTKQMSDLTFRRNVTANYVQKLIDNIENLNRPLTDEEVTKINRLHDKVYDLEQEMHGLERRWDTRNWTAGDWASYELVAANID